MPRLSSTHATSPFIWCAGIICAIISIAVIIGGIVIFVGYMVIHPRVPIISVEYAHLDLLKYDIVGVMQTQLTIVIRAENDNAKAPALFDKTNFKLSYEGKIIAYLKQDEFVVAKEKSVFSHYVVQSSPIPLSTQMKQAIDYAIKQDVIVFELKGGSKARWRVGPIGSVKFECNLSCELRSGTDWLTPPRGFPWLACEQGSDPALYQVNPSPT
uniref:Late embryogenesis abundant protein LEA-2 subgroup domain-containing protein n=1 Tax=Brassica campestris TaxID=3711 RepID=M4E8H8_BRACM